MLLWWLKQKPDAEKDLAALTHSLRSALGDQLKSVVVFGSLASGEFKAERSNVNTLIVADMSLDSLRRLGPVLRVWSNKGQVAPVLVAPEEVSGMARSFPIEFLDMLDYHRVLFGPDPLAGMIVDRKHLAAECEHDLASIELKLRQAVAAAAGDAPRIRQALHRSLSSVQALLRAVVRLEENVPELDKIKAAQRLGERLKIDLTVLRELSEWHLRRAADNVNDMADRYMNLIRALLNHLRSAGK